MHLIENGKSVWENYETLGGIIDTVIQDLVARKAENKKVIEVCHVGKFLMLLGGDNSIEQVMEQPDFIVKTNVGKVGVEHQVIIDTSSKEKEGFFENIFSIAETELQSDIDLPNFLANCYMRPYLTYSIADKARYVEEVKRVVKQYILTGKMEEDSIIDRISSMPHSARSLSVNFGAWWQKPITEELILDAVNQKEKKLINYVKNTGLPIWLLLVIGSLKESSFEVDKVMDIHLQTQFQRVFLLEDFSARLWILK